MKRDDRRGDALPSRKRPTVKALFMATLFGAAGAGIGYLFGKHAAGMPWLRQHFESLGTPDLLALPLLMPRAACMSERLRGSGLRYRYA